MLKIWYYGNIDYMKYAPSYFDNVYEDEWIEDTFVKEMIQDVDHCAVISSHIMPLPMSRHLPNQYLLNTVLTLM